MNFVATDFTSTPVAATVQQAAAPVYEMPA
jgi:hypothetical protein